MANFSHVNCLTNAFYMCMLFFKIQYFVHLFRWIVFKLKERIIIFVDWSSIFFIYKLFLQIVKIKHIVIMINQKFNERNALINQFNDKTNDFKTLLTFQRIFNSFFNFQTTCRFMIIFENFSFFNNIFQCDDRMFWIEQLFV